MCKCPVSFSHTMGIFFLFESSTFLFVGSHNFSRKFFSHAVSASLAGVKDHIFYRDRSFTGRINFSRHLESSTTDTAALYFYLRSNILQCLLPDLQSRFLFFGLVFLISFRLRICSSSCPFWSSTVSQPFTQLFFGNAS